MATWNTESKGSGTKNQIHNVKLTIIYHTKLPHCSLQSWNNITFHNTSTSIIREGKI